MFKKLDNNAAPTLTFTFDGQPISAHEGDTIASALLLAGEIFFRTTPSGEHRGPFCLMGACYECLVEVDGRNVQACMTPVMQGMDVRRATAADSFARRLSDD